MADLETERIVVCDVIGCSWGHNALLAPDAPIAEVEWVHQRQRAIVEEHRKTHTHVAEVIDGPLKGARVAYVGNEPRTHVDVTVPSSEQRASVTDYRSYGMPAYTLRLYRFTIADPSGKPIGYVFSIQNGYLSPDAFKRIRYNDWVYAAIPRSDLIIPHDTKARPGIRSGAGFFVRSVASPAPSRLPLADGFRDSL